ADLDDVPRELREALGHLREYLATALRDVRLPGVEQDLVGDVHHELVSTTAELDVPALDLDLELRGQIRLDRLELGLELLLLRDRLRQLHGDLHLLAGELADVLLRAAELGLEVRCPRLGFVALRGVACRLTPQRQIEEVHEGARGERQRQKEGPTDPPEGAVAGGGPELVGGGSLGRHSLTISQNSRRLKGSSRVERTWDVARRDGAHAQQALHVASDEIDLHVEPTACGQLTEGRR